MKNFVNGMICCLIGIILLDSCQSEENFSDSNIGYLRLDFTANTSNNTKASGDEEYNAKVLQVSILKENGESACEPFEYDATSSMPEKTLIELPTGTYTVKASSAGFDGKTSSYDKPYYVGYAENVVVKKDTETSAKIVCSLANVKVTVNFDQSFKDAFKTAAATISSLEEGAGGQLVFQMGGTESVGYFPVTDLIANIAVVNKSDISHSDKYEIKNVKAKDHYIFNYKVAESGSGSIGIQVDDATRTYTYDFAVPVESKLAVTANAWSNFAYLEGSVPSSDKAIDPSKIEFQYKLSSEGEEGWKKVDGELLSAGEGVYKITLKGLSPNTAYQCRISYDSESSVSSTIDFTTEEQVSIPNLNFDDWYKNVKSWYPCKEADFSKKFWDSGNEGSNTINEVNPTKQETSDVIKGSAARLTSTEVNAFIFNVFAAGSLFSGDFLEAVVGGIKPEDSGAKLSFGQPYSARPVRMTGYYKYNPVNVNYTSSKVPQVKNGDRDSCSIYIALTDWNESFTVNTQSSTFVDINDGHIIAYGELSKDEMSPESMDEYKQFSIDLKYRDLTRKPKYILIVCSSSKYGDYFVGGVGSTLLVDEFNIEFGEPSLAAEP